VLSRSADGAVRIMGGDPSRRREDVTEEELRDLVATQISFTEQQRTIISGAFEIADRRLREVLRPRRDVVTLDTLASCEDALAILVTSGHSRAPVADGGDLDRITGVVHMRDLVGAVGTAGMHARPPVFLPDSTKVLDALRHMQVIRNQLAVVVNEHGGAEGIVTVEDLVEELVGEIYDEADQDILRVKRGADGSMVLPGRFPIHDLIDLGVEWPKGDYATVAGAVLAESGHIPVAGEITTIGAWFAEVLEVDGHAITRVRLWPVDGLP
jgi:putative hemolysin